MKPEIAFVGVGAAFVVMIGGLAQERSYMPGHLDPEFHARVTGSVMSVAIQPDGKILIGGVISAVNGQPCANVVRLLPDGSTDPGFAARANLPVRRIRSLADGRILLAGDFSEVNQVTRRGLARLQSDGAVDADFDTSWLWEGSWFTDVQALSGGGAMTCGPFLRLLPNGRRDESFEPDYYDGQATSIQLLANGGFMLTGWQSVGMGGWQSINVVRVLPDGRVDRGFAVPQLGSHTGIGGVRALRVLPDGDYLIGGDFTSIRLTQTGLVARLNPDGTLDSDFACPIGWQEVYAMEIQNDGKVVVGGFIPSGNVHRLLPAGNPDPAFSNRTRANATVYALAVQQDGRILVGGDFTEFDHELTGGLVRLRGGEAAEVLPEFTLHPASRGILEGRTLNLSAAAEAWPPPHLQWQRNGQDLPGAITNLLVLTNANSLVGGEYRVIASNPAGSATSQVAQVTFQPASTDSGALDIHDDPSALISDSIFAFLLQDDGKLLVAGRGPIRRLTRGRTLDSTFPSLVPGGLASAWINCLVGLGDGGFLAGGSFVRISGTEALYLGRFDRDGQRDTTFNPQFSGEVRCAALDREGRILVGGSFSGLAGQPAWRLMRLLADGTLDLSFVVPSIAASTDYVQQIVVTPVGQVVAGGRFKQIGSISRAGLVRFDPDGNIDPDFDPLEGSSVVAGLLQGQDGTLIVAGSLKVRGRADVVGMCRLFPDGRLDPSLVPLSWRAAPQYSRSALLMLPDGRVVANYPAAPPLSEGSLTMFLTGGEVDDSFRPAVSSVDAIFQDLDGSFLVAGAFSSVEGLPRKRLARLHGDPDRRLSLSQVGAATVIFPFRTVKGHRYALEAKPDFGAATWTSIREFTGDGTTNEIAVPLSPDANQFYRVRIGR